MLNWKTSFNHKNFKLKNLAHILGIVVLALLTIRDYNLRRSYCPTSVQQNQQSNPTPSPTPFQTSFRKTPISYEYNPFSYLDEQDTIQHINTIIAVSSDEMARGEKFTQVIKNEDSYYVSSHLLAGEDGFIINSYISRFSLDWKSRTILIDDLDMNTGFINKMLFDNDSKYLYFISNFGGPANHTKRINLENELMSEIKYPGYLIGILPKIIRNEQYTTYAGSLILSLRSYHKDTPTDYEFWFVNPDNGEKLFHLTTMSEDFETSMKQLSNQYQLY